MLLYRTRLMSCRSRSCTREPGFATLFRSSSASSSGFTIFGVLAQAHSSFQLYIIYCIFDFVFCVCCHLYSWSVAIVLSMNSPWVTAWPYNASWVCAAATFSFACFCACFLASVSAVCGFGWVWALVVLLRLVAFSGSVPWQLSPDLDGDCVVIVCYYCSRPAPELFMFTVYVCYLPLLAFVYCYVYYYVYYN